MDIICKFRCESVTFSSSGGSIKLVPVTSGSPENDKFFKWTPYGSLEIGTINANVMDEFVPGQEYFINITKA